MALHLACLRIGAVTNPVMPIFRHRELTFMLGLAESKVMIVPREFRGFDHAAMLREIQPALPQLKHIFAIGGEGEMSFEKHFIERRWEQETPDAERLLTERRLRPDEVMQLLYTSGTTGEPKGALHTSNTHFANIVEIAKRCGLTAEHVCFAPSPMAHQTGFGIGMAMPMMLGAKLVLQDVWDAEVALQRIQDEGVNFMMAATPFLADLTDHSALDKYDISTLNIFISAGAPISRVLVQRATDRLKAHIVSGWGMTENPLVTTTRIGDQPEKVFGTDGVPMPDMEVRVVDAVGHALATGGEGELESKGPSNFVGYLKRPERFDTDEEGCGSRPETSRASMPTAMCASPAGPRTSSSAAVKTCRWSRLSRCCTAIRPSRRPPWSACPMRVWASAPWPMSRSGLATVLRSTR